MLEQNKTSDLNISQTDDSGKKSFVINPPADSGERSKIKLKIREQNTPASNANPSATESKRTLIKQFQTVNIREIFRETRNSCFALLALIFLIVCMRVIVWDIRRSIDNKAINEAIEKEIKHYCFPQDNKKMRFKHDIPQTVNSKYLYANKDLIDKLCSLLNEYKDNAPKIRQDTITIFTPAAEDIQRHYFIFKYSPELANKLKDIRNAYNDSKNKRKRTDTFDANTNFINDLENIKLDLNKIPANSDLVALLSHPDKLSGRSSFKQREQFENIKEGRYIIVVFDSKFSKIQYGDVYKRADQLEYILD